MQLHPQLKTAACQYAAVLRVAAVLLPLFVISGFARDRMDAPSGPKESICGFLKNFNYLEQADVKQGLAVDLLVDQAQLNKPVTLRFFVHQKPGDLPVDKLELQHEKYLHVLGVRDDLNEFFHIHPARTAPGVWEVTHVFTNAGNYKLWSEVQLLGVSYSFGHPLMSLSGTFGNPDTNREPMDRVVTSGFQVTFKHSEPLIAGRASNLEFLIRDLSGKEIKTENFLGAPMHLVIIKDDLSVCLHAHPEKQSRPRPIVSFTQMFSKPGLYRLFAQFRPVGSKLPADDAILAAFYVRVVSSPVAPFPTGELR